MWPSMWHPQVFPKPKKRWWNTQLPGQIITTSAEGIYPNGGLVREVSPKCPKQFRFRNYSNLPSNYRKRSCFSFKIRLFHLGQVGDSRNFLKFSDFFIPWNPKKTTGIRTGFFRSVFVRWGLCANQSEHLRLAAAFGGFAGDERLRCARV